MTLPYIPGWWDTTKKDILPFVENLQHAVAPNFYAQKNFEQIVSQNPQIIGQVSNMNPAERTAYAKSLGYKGNKDPFANMPKGRKLIDQEEEDRVVANLTPEELASRNAQKFNFTPQESINRRRVEDTQKTAEFDTRQTEAAQNLKIGEQQQKINTYKLADLEIQYKGQIAALEKYPELSHIRMDMIVDQVLHKQQVDPMLMQRIKDNPGALKLFEETMETRRHEIAAEMREKQIKLQENRQDARVRQNDLMEKGRLIGMGLTQANTYIDNNKAEIDKLLTEDRDLKDWVNASEADRKKSKYPPSAQNLQRYEGLLAQKRELQNRAAHYSDGYDKFTAQFKEMQDTARKEEEKIGPPPDQVTATVVDRIEKGVATLEQALASAALTDATKAYLKKKYAKK